MRRQGSRSCEECGTLEDLWEISAGVYLCDDCSGYTEAAEAAEWDGTPTGRTYDDY